MKFELTCDKCKHGQRESDWSGWWECIHPKSKLHYFANVYNPQRQPDHCPIREDSDD